MILTKGGVRMNLTSYKVRGYFSRAAQCGECSHVDFSKLRKPRRARIVIHSRILGEVSIDLSRHPGPGMAEVTIESPDGTIITVWQGQNF